MTSLSSGSETFALGRHAAIVVATEDALEIAMAKKPVLRLLWADVLGASTGHDTIGATCSLPLLIHVVEKTKNGKRKLRDVVLTSCGEASNGIHQLEVDKWVRIIQYFANPCRPLVGLPTLDAIMQHPPKQRTFLVLINPVGGTGKGEHIYGKVETILGLANIRVEKIVTDRPKHATDVARTLDVSSFDCLVVVGGDGFVYEVVQGLMQRQDWATAIQLPLAILPAGTGNGLAKSICDGANELCTPESAMYLAAKGCPLPLDVATLRNATTTSYLLLSLTWGFMAEIDHDSEKYRFFGAQRFVVGTIVKLIAPKSWHGTLSYLPSSDEDEPPYADTSVTPALLPAVGEPVPSNWARLEGDMSLFWAMNVSHAANDAKIAPSARLDDGYWHIVLMQGKASRTEYASMMLGIEKGQHVHQPTVQVIKTRAFQLETPPENLLMADGERCDGGLWQVQVHRGLARVMGLPAPNEYK